MADRIKIQEAGGVQEDGYAVVIARTARGERFILRHAFDNVEAAEAFSKRVVAKGDIDLTHWVSTYPVYGSEAGQEEEWEAARYEAALCSGSIREDHVPDVYRSYFM